MTCDLARELLDRREAFGSDSGSSGGVQPLLSHLTACTSCRKRALQADPSLLFAISASRPPAPDWTGLTARVRAAIEEQERKAGWVGRLLDAGILAPGRFVPALGAAAAIALVVALAWHAAPGRFGGRAGSLPATPPVARLGPEGIVPPAVAPAHITELMPSAAPPPVESVASPTARVVQMRIGEDTGVGAAGEAGSSDVVLILDEGIDL